MDAPDLVRTKDKGFNVLLSYGLRWYMVLDLKYTSESHGAELWASVWVTW